MYGILIGVTIALVAFAGTSAEAIEKCGAKVDKKTGTILVSASGVSGTLLWGSAQGEETSALFNVATCVADGKASKCTIADPATLAAKTPPEGCTLYLDDSGAACSAWIPGCTPGTRSASTCVPDPSASPRFVDNGDGTVSDNATCLMWEKKTGTADGYSACPGGPSCGSVHHVNNAYSWSDGVPVNPDGSAFTMFLAELNGPTPFAGHDDWRLPTITELQGIVDLTACATAPDYECIDSTFFGPSHRLIYWSSSASHMIPGDAWGVYLGDGSITSAGRSTGEYVRAVRSVSR